MHHFHGRFLLRFLGPAAVCFAIQAQAESVLVHRYSFNETAGSTVTDPVGGPAWDGTLPNGGTFGGGEVALSSGSQQYVQLPPWILNNYTAVTIEAWVTFPSQLPGACFLFGLGNISGTAGQDYIFCQPRAGRIAITDGASGSEQNASGAGDWSFRTNQHIVAVFNPPAGQLALYTNGVLAAVNSSITIPFTSVSNYFSYIGRSLYSADAYFDFSLTEFRIYDGALTESQIQDNYANGPDVLAFNGPVEFIAQPRSQTVTELAPVTFTASYSGTPPVGTQWRRNGVDISGATNGTYTLATTALTNDGAAFSVVLTNSHLGTNYIAPSSNAVLTVTADTTPPMLVRAASLYPTEVQVTFSENVRADTATNAANYVITRAGGPLAVTGARADANAAQVILTTAAQTPGTNYTLTVNGVRDPATAGNLIATNSQTSFTATTFLVTDIGVPAIAGTFAGGATNGGNITASGSGISGTADQFTFASRSFTNDFDVQMRLASLGFANAWTRAALMARDGMASNAMFAASVATPGPAGCHFEARTNAGGTARMAGAFPVNYPDTWLRLRRAGNVFGGYASLDGQTWEFLGSSTIAMANIVQAGFALTAGSATGSTTAEFRDFANGSGAMVTNSPLPFEPPGPSSRRTALVISEIMYNPPDVWGGTNNLEFVELWNSGLVTEDLTGHTLSGEIDYTFPANTTIAPGQFLVVAKDPAAAQNYYGITCLGPYGGKLANEGGALRLVNELGGRLLEIEYNNKAPWPVAADGTGHSLVLSRPSYGEGDPRAWSASDVMGGSPGTFEHYGSEPARGVVINEFLAHTDLPQEDCIELFNTGTQTVNLSGAWLSDEAGTNKYQIANGTTIPARGFLAFTQTQLGFALSADGEKIFLVNSNQTRVLDAVDFDGQENGVSLGRYPDGAPGFQRLTTVTQGTGNTPRRLPPVVINEIMYHPISEDDNDEYVEFYNRSGGAVNLTGWKLQGGISFTFPSNTVLAAGGHLVVAENLTNLLAKHSQLNSTNTFGNFNGKLANSGERLALAMPEDLVSTNASGGVSTNIFYITLDEVTYADGGRWGQWSDGGGSSLELIDPDADTRLAANWADSDESAKAAWTTIDVTNVMENGQPGHVNEGNGSYGVANRFEAFLQGPGEALLDSLEFRSNGGSSLLANGTFNPGINGWTLGGVLRGSYAQAGVGMGGSQALHLVSTERGDTGPNKIFSALTSTAATGNPNTGTLRASVRWLKGSPYILLRIRGNWMEVSQRLNVPANCGTPGQPNSRLVGNAGPAITDVSHSPVLPAAGQSVVVSARVSDPDGVGSATLKFRIDPATSYTSVPMLDNGTGGDALAGDGLYSASIPGRPSGETAAFYISATDGAGATSQFPAAAPTRECHVRWGESTIAGSLGSYRLWVTSSNITFWGSREKNANDPIDATFVYGNSRVVYNVDTLYSGSPFHTPGYDGPLGSMACDYEVNFPPDDRFLGSGPFVLTAYDVTSGNFFFNDDSGQVDLTGTWIGRKLGLAYNYRRHVHVVVNGQQRGTIYDDAQQPNNEMLAEYFPGDEHGQLRKIESWFEFADNGQDQGSTYATLDRVNKSTGEIDAKRYRWNWRPRATDNPNDWADFVSLVAAVSNTNAPNYESQVRAWMDIGMFLRPLITHHVCGSWDSYAYERGKNMYAYKPDDQPWRLLMWDIELSLGAGGNAATDSIYNMFDKTLLRLITNTPAIHREYLRGFREAVDTALMPGAADTALDERYAAFQQNSVALISPQFIKNYISSRRAYLLTVLPNAAFALTSATNQTVSASNTVTLTGTGPLSVENILVNSNAYTVTWTSVSNWSVTVPLAGGTNVLNLAATDRNGNSISNATGTVTANYTGSTVTPEGFVVFNEIQYRPATNGGAFVELFNALTNYTFNLSGWSVNGVDYTFPAGATLPPRHYLVLAENTFAYNQTYGAMNVAFDAFNGTLDDNGETLTLLRPGAGTNVVVVDRVRYEAAVPWPVITNGAALQLIDVAQDNGRVANWTVGSTNAVVPPQMPDLALLALSSAWKYQQDYNLDGQTWMAPAYDDSTWPSGPGLLAFEDNAAIMPLIQTTLNDPRVGTAYVSSGHAYYFRTTLVVTGSLAGYQINATARVDDGAVIYLNGTEVSPRLRMNAGAVSNTTLASALPSGGDTTTPDTFTLPASVFVVGTNVIAVEVHQYTTTSSDVVFGLQLDATCTNTITASGTTLCTPGAANSVATNLPAFPPLWLNEAQANNITGPLDNYSQHDPWAEIFNSATTNVSLAGCYLTDTYTNLTKWAFPADAVVSSNGFRLVWCDNQTNQTAAGSLHAAFTLPSGSGSLAITRQINGTNQIVDYLNYTNLPANWSYGSVPDGQPFYRRAMFYTTPGATNNGASAPITIFINEWLADNTATLTDPADGQFEDWFELYNPGTNDVDVGGYFLSDELTEKFEFQIPNNGHYIVPAGGYLLVWADDEAGQNSTNRADLHVNFGLNKNGDAIGLFAADGTTIDAVTFGAQTANVSQGRFPNGAANIYAMPTPTPRAANVVPNTAPMLDAIGTRVLTLGQTLNLTVSGSDNDTPVQTLSYSLASAPAGAQIGGTSGVLTWTPVGAPSTNSFIVVVADNGTPSLTATQAFTVTVALPPVLGSFSVTGTALAFSWESVLGQSYQVEYKSSLADPAWMPGGDVIIGTGGILSVTNEVEEASQRFFRLRLLP